MANLEALGLAAPSNKGEQVAPWLTYSAARLDYLQTLGHDVSVCFLLEYGVDARCSARHVIGRQIF